MMRIYSIAPILTAASLLCASRLGLSPTATETAKPALRVTVMADGRALAVEGHSRAVGEILAGAGITLSKLDRVSPSPRTTIGDGSVVRVTRVSRREEVEEVAIPAETILLADPERPAGYTNVLERGQDGRMERVVRIWEKDGEETQRTVIEEKVLEPTRATVVMRGTLGLTTRGGNWRRPLRMIATGYEPGPRSCGRYASGRTAIGLEARKGVAAVDDRVIPLRTRLYIPGYGFAIAGDRGSAIKGMRIDLCFDTYREAIRWGRRRVKVYVLY